MLATEAFASNAHDVITPGNGAAYSTPGDIVWTQMLFALQLVPSGANVCPIVVAALAEDAAMRPMSAATASAVVPRINRRSLTPVRSTSWTMPLAGVPVKRAQVPIEFWYSV